MTAWTAERLPAAVTPGAVTLIEGTAFCVCGPSGDILPGATEGIYFRDARLVSRWQLRVAGEPVEPLAVMPATPFCATFVGRSRPRPGKAETTVLITRARYVDDGLREDIAVHHFSEEPAGYEAVQELLPHVDRALRWIEMFGDPDGDAFVEYRRKADRGLVNRGWKDSFDGINFADGTLAQPPIALAEVQGYVYAAYLARAHIAWKAGDASAGRVDISGLPPHLQLVKEPEPLPAAAPDLGGHS